MMSVSCVREETGSQRGLQEGKRKIFFFVWLIVLSSVFHPYCGWWLTAQSVAS